MKTSSHFTRLQTFFSSNVNIKNVYSYRHRVKWKNNNTHNKVDKDIESIQVVIIKAQELLTDKFSVNHLNSCMQILCDRTDTFSDKHLKKYIF